MHKRWLPQKPTITSQEWEQIRQEAQAAQELLEDPALPSSANICRTPKPPSWITFHNRIKTVHERLKVGDALTKVLIITRREQERELSGRYRFIEALLEDLRRIASLPEEYRKAQEGSKLTG
ncbi:MAG: hypothetical protein H5T69_12240 [Chloroflexi bacterium]|nr:hypothetical protein [Chloroflexota bacterium]